MQQRRARAIHASAHDRTLRAAPGRQLTLVVAAEPPSVLLMVGYTWAGLFLLFAA